jgi:cytochrome c5
VTEHDAHPSFIKTPRQLIVVILLAFLVPIIVIILLVELIVSRPGADPAAMTPEAVSARIQAVAKLEFGAPAAAPGAPPAPKQSAKPQAAAKTDGKKVYDSLCVACHAQSVAGSPPLGDKAAWAPRIQQGSNALVQSVIKGKGAMPPKAGNAALSDGEIRAAVEFMVSQAR